MPETTILLYIKKWFGARAKMASEILQLNSSIQIFKYIFNIIIDEFLGGDLLL